MIGNIFVILAMSVACIPVGIIIVAPLATWLSDELGDVANVIFRMFMALFGAIFGAILAYPFNNLVVYGVLAIAWAILWGTLLFFKWLRSFGKWLWKKLPGATWTKTLICVSVLIVAIAGIVFLSGLIF